MSLIPTNTNRYAHLAENAEFTVSGHVPASWIPAALEELDEEDSRSSSSANLPPVGVLRLPTTNRNVDQLLTVEDL